VNVKLFTYNTAMLPDPWGFRKSERAQGLLKVLAQCEYDILCLQEVFDETIRQTLKDGLVGKFPYIVEKADDNDFLNEDSGLFFASRFPVRGVTFREFSAKSYSSSDVFADKGIFGACLAITDGQVLFVFNTHLQSGITHSQARDLQITEISDFVRQVLTGPHGQAHLAQKRGVLLAGDFNVIGDIGEEYAEMLKRLGNPRDLYRELNPVPAGYTWNSEENSLIKENDTTDKDMERLDYIFAYNHVPVTNEKAGNNPGDNVVPPEEHLPPLQCLSCRIIKPKSMNSPGLPDQYDLSDHYALEAEFTV